MCTDIVGRIHCYSMAFVVAATLLWSAAQAQTLVHFDLPAQSLAESLRAIGAATKTDIGFSTSQVAGLSAPAVKADLTVDAALSRVLTGTGLRLQHVDDHFIVLVAVDSSAADSVPKKSESPKPSIPGEPAKPVPQTLNVVDKSADLGSPQVDVPDQGQKANFEGKGDRNYSPQLDELVVTGTNIRGEKPVGAPILTIDSVQIAQSGYTTTQDLIQSLPANFRGGAAGASADALLSSGSNAGYNQSFGSGINLRGLGNTATLILVNGHRVASSGGGYFTDISTIPISAIDHIDVVTDGASAIYGSDAIAGVVNIVLKKDSQGLEVGARYGAGNGFSNDGGNLQLGDRWANGGLTFGADFSHQDSLDTSQRSFTSAIASPTSIVPSYAQTALSVAAHQGFGDQIELHGDAQYTTTKKTGFDSAGTPTLRQAPDVDRWSGSAGASYQITNSWSLRYDFSAGEGVENTSFDYWNEGSPSLDDTDRVVSRFSDHELGISGELFSLPAGSVKLAAGASYRTESYHNDEHNPTGDLGGFSADRSIDAGYGEIRIPVFSESNATPGLRKLTLSAAVRRDHYSDFGNTTNPKFGISWFPIESLEFRGAYSTSFRAPATGVELVSSKVGTTTIAVFPFLSPDQTTQVPVVYLVGARPNLGPETARNLTFGLDFKPSFAAGLQVSLNYYDITYSNQLAAPPFSPNALSDPALASEITKYASSVPVQALVNAAIQNGVPYYDGTNGAFGPNPLTTAVYVYDGRTQNLSATDTSGFDLSVRYPVSIGIDRIDINADVTYIDKFTAQITPGSPPASEVNTVGYPARFRTRTQAVWTRGALSASIAANYVSSYPDTSSSTPRQVGSFTTVDFVARYDLSGTALAGMHGVVATLAAINILDRLPPYVADGTLGYGLGSHYDPANASPLGRLLTVGLTKRW